MPGGAAATTPAVGATAETSPAGSAAATSAARSAASPDNRILCDHNTGAGNTHGLLTMLNKLLHDSRKKVIILPNKALADQFLDDMMRWPNNYHSVVENLIHEEREHRPTSSLRKDTHTTSTGFIWLPKSQNTPPDMSAAAASNCCCRFTDSSDRKAESSESNEDVVPDLLILGSGVTFSAFADVSWLDVFLVLTTTAIHYIVDSHHIII